MYKFNRHDTIVALATAPGTGAIAVIRLSGAQAIAIAETIFSSGKNRQKLLSEAASHTLHFGRIYENETILDEVVVSVFRTPHSYTGEDTIEISCHGSPFIQQHILQLCQKSGARPAQPGEFTLRAFLNGKMDLSRAEAVADLIAADSAFAHKLAMQQMRGGFSEEIKHLRKELIHFASLIELELDFAEEDVEFASRKELQDVVVKLQKVIFHLIESFESGNVIRTGIPVVIAGKPNAGKSTLLNVLLNEERAIVSEVAGTTRDTVEEEIILEGIKFRFIDTAGIRETHDVIEQIGVNKAWEKIKQSPLVIYLFDANETSAENLLNELKELHEQISPDVRILSVANKIDLNDRIALEKKYSSFNDLFYISAKQNIHVHYLVSTLLSSVKSGFTNLNDSIVTNARHANALQKTSDALSRVHAGLQKKITNDFIADDLRTALYHLGEITGEISTDDLLENIFSKFCIGK